MPNQKQREVPHQSYFFYFGGVLVIGRTDYLAFKKDAGQQVTGTGIDIVIASIIMIYIYHDHDHRCHCEHRCLHHRQHTCTV